MKTVLENRERFVAHFEQEEGWLHGVIVRDVDLSGLEQLAPTVLDTFTQTTPVSSCILRL